MTVAEKVEYIDKKVLIKEIGRGFHDKVYMVKGVPKDLLFTEDGKLQPGILKSMTGDGAFVFDTTREARERLEAFDRYVASVYPRNLPSPKRIYNAQQPGDPRSAPLTLELLEGQYQEQFRVPFVDLPVPEDGMVMFKAKSATESAIATFEGEVLPSTAVPEPKVRVPRSDEMCAQCDYVGKNKRALIMHINVKHKKVKDGPSDNPS